MDGRHKTRRCQDGGDGLLSPALAVISFVAPWMAWGAAAAVGLPLLAHLLSKTRYREVVFPAARLVQQAVAATSRIETPRHRLLMLLRWLVLLLLVLAFMRPQWVPQAEARQTERGIALVLLIDASASMQRTADGATLYDRALREAQRLISQLNPSKDAAAVIRVDHAPASLLPEPTAQFNLLADQLTNTKPGYTHASWTSAIAVAQRLNVDGPRTLRLVTLSDQQGEQPAFDDVLADRPRAQIDHLRIEGPTDNIAIQLMDVRPYPAIVGQATTATVEVKYFGDQPLSTSIGATFEDHQAEQAISLAPGAVQRIELGLPPTSGTGGLLQVTLAKPDAIAADNLAGVWLPTQEQTRVLIVYDANDAGQATAQRLATLLNPGKVAGVTLPDIQMVAIDDTLPSLDGADPAALRTVVLLSQSPMNDAMSQSLEAYAQLGGGIVQFVTDPGVDRKRTTTAVGIDFSLEPLRLFEGPARAGLAALPWPGVSNAPIDPLATPILQDELERNIVAEMPRGRGRLIAINAALSDKPGGLLAEPAFVVLFNELCRYASPGVWLPEPARPGDPMPAGLRDVEQFLSPKDADAEANVFTAPGAYAAVGSSGAIKSLLFASLDPSESDTRLPDAWSQSNAANNTSLQSVDQAGQSIANTLRSDPVELWPYLVFGVLGLVACESLLLWRFAGPGKPLVRGTA